MEAIPVKTLTETPEQYTERLVSFACGEVARTMAMKDKKDKETLIDEMVRLVFHTEPWIEHCYQWPPDETGRYNEWIEFKGG